MCVCVYLCLCVHARVTLYTQTTMSLAEFGEIADQQLAKGNPVPVLGRPKSGKAYLKPAEDDGAAEGSKPEGNVEELTDVDKPAKERQKVSPVDCTALGKAKQQLYHMINVLIHSAYYSVLMNWSGWSSESLTPIKSWLVESNLKKHETSGVVKIRKLEMDCLSSQARVPPCHPIHHSTWHRHQGAVVRTRRSTNE